MTPVNQHLNPWHRRQATLLYHFASLPYLQGLLDRVSLFPALLEFRETVLRAIAARSQERYSQAGEHQCARMLAEYGLSVRAIGEEEGPFKHDVDAVFDYARNISRVMRRPTTLDDFIFWVLWEKNKQQFKRIPRFLVHKDIQCISGQTPPRTGVYVPQDDPMAALQFGWTGGHGELGDTYTLSDFGKLALERVGRAGLWIDESGLHALINEPRHRHLPNIYDIEREHAKLSPAAVSRQGFEGRPCKWYFVEMLDGEYEDHDGSYTGHA